MMKDKKIGVGIALWKEDGRQWVLAEEPQNLFSSLETNPLVQQGCKFPVLFWVTKPSKEVIKTEGAVML